MKQEALRNISNIPLEDLDVQSPVGGHSATLQPANSSHANIADFEPTFLTEISSRCESFACFYDVAVADATTAAAERGSLA